MRSLILAVGNVRTNTSKGVVMLKVCGKIVWVKSEKVEKTQRNFKRLQLYSNGGNGRAVLHDVTDMANEDWAFGSEVEIPCSIDVYQGKKGMGYALTYWGGRGVASTPTGPPPGGSPAVDGGKGKFGG